MSTHPLADLSDYLDGDLDAAARAAIDAHLTICAECRAVVADLTALQRAAAAWRDADAAPAQDLWPAVAARLQGPREVAPGVVSAPLVGGRAAMPGQRSGAGAASASRQTVAARRSAVRSATAARQSAQPARCASMAARAAASRSPSR